jgi:hypothetical protein
MSSLPFREIWAEDFEYNVSKGEHPEPLCVTAWELLSRRKIQLWQDQFGKSPPYSLGEDSLFVSYSANAELSCHLALGWAFPRHILDLRIEFKRAINTTPKHESFKDASFLQALTHYGLDAINAGEKDFWRELILRGGPWTVEEQAGILKYNESDVEATDRLFFAMLARGDITGETVNDFVPPWAAIVGTTQPSGFTYFGSVSQVASDAGGFEEAYGVQLVPRIWYDEHNETAEYRLQSRATLCPWDVASWTVINCTPPSARRGLRGVSIPTEGSEPQPKSLKKGA